MRAWRLAVLPWRVVWSCASVASSRFLAVV
jgi:hypothetical protein